MSPPVTTPASRASVEASLETVPRLVRACHARMGSPLDATDLDDAIQEARVTAWRRLDTFRGDSTLDSWLYGIARLSILKQLAARRRTADRERDIDAARYEPEVGPGPATRADTAILRIVDDSLGRQGTTVREIVRRKGLEEDSFVEIADDLAMPAATVKTRYYRSLPRIRQLLTRVWRDVSA